MHIHLNMPKVAEKPARKPVQKASNLHQQESKVDTCKDISGCSKGPAQTILGYAMLPKKDA